jgi:hypothetical protein
MWGVVAEIDLVPFLRRCEAVGLMIFGPIHLDLPPPVKADRLHHRNTPNDLNRRQGLIHIFNNIKRKNVPYIKWT